MAVISLTGAPTAGAAAGDLDQNFGSGGAVLGIEGFADPVALQNDGKLLVGGSIGAENGVLRYHADGSRDMQFGSGGVFQDRFRAGLMRAIVVLPDSKIMAAAQGVLWRLNRDGTPDTSFDSEGAIAAIDNGRTVISTLAVQADGEAGDGW